MAHWCWLSGGLASFAEAEMSADEAERERTAVAATAAVAANQTSVVQNELKIEIASDIAAVVLLPVPGKLSLYRHSLTDFANYYPTYYAYVHLIDSIAVVALLDSATNCL